jgi:hypothetical protein
VRTSSDMRAAQVLPLSPADQTGVIGNYRRREDPQRPKFLCSGRNTRHSYGAGRSFCWHPRVRTSARVPSKDRHRLAIRRIIVPVANSVRYPSGSTQHPLCRFGDNSLGCCMHAAWIPPEWHSGGGIETVQRCAISTAARLPTFLSAPSRPRGSVRKTISSFPRNAFERPPQ